MDIAEYLVFIPLLLYGISLADLLSEWKRILEPKHMYWPYSLLTIMLTETAVYNIYVYQNLIEALAYAGYYDYLTFLIPPFLFLMLTHAFTPDKESDTELYFKDRMRVVFLLTALFISSKFLHSFNEPPLALYLRGFFIVTCIIIAWQRKIWMIYLLFTFWVITFATRKFVEPERPSNRIEAIEIQEEQE